MAEEKATHCAQCHAIEVWPGKNDGERKDNATSAGWVLSRRRLNGHLTNRWNCPDCARSNSGNREAGNQPS